jgi:hypothetical protein
MRANDWRRAADLFADGFVVDWPCTGERISRREDFVAIQELYPASGPWRFDIHRLLVDGPVAVTEFTASDGEQTARAIAFSEIHDGRIARQVEYWPSAYEPLAWRASLVERIDAIP